MRTFIPLLALPVSLAASIATGASISYDALSGTKSNQIDSAPVGLSFEFFAFPDYVNTVPSTTTCLANLQSYAGSAPPVRIGGTTQDRATWNASQTSAVSYTVASASDAPTSVTYGPSFFDIANTMPGRVVPGVPRRLNDLTGSTAAIKSARSKIDNPLEFELGNEPDLYTASDPIAKANGNAWTPSIDRHSQLTWQKAIAQALSISTPFIQAGVFLQPPKFAIADLAPAEKLAGQSNLVGSYADHAYPQSACGGSSTNLTILQDHTNIVTFVKGFAAEIAAADAQGVDHVFGETNSATCGGGGISPTYGAALWILDYVMQAVKAGSKRLYFHQGTIGNCQYCWWGRYSMGNPYYGAVLATKALSGITNVAQLDDGTTAYAAYGLYAGSTLAKVLLINTQYYTTGTRPTQGFTLTNLPGSIGNGIRLTAASSTARADQGASASVGGVTYKDGTCAASGSFKTEPTTITGGIATFTLAASEALLVTFS